MNFSNFNTHSQSPNRAFEALCNHLFEKWLQRNHQTELINFIPINGDGGDGGVEAYGGLRDGSILGIQSKWFNKSLSTSQIGQIRKSIITAKGIRAELKKVIVCAPRDLTNKKIVNKRKSLVSTNTDYSKVESLKTEIKSQFSDLIIEYWGEYEIERELMFPDNVGIQQYWFNNSVIDFEYIKHRFEVSKSGWLSKRYIPDIHSEGFIQKRVKAHLRSHEYIELITNRLKSVSSQLYQISERLDDISSEIWNPDIDKFYKQVNTLNGKIQYLIISIGNQEVELFESVEIDVYAVLQVLHNSTPTPVKKHTYEQLLNELNDFDSYQINGQLKLISLECKNQYVLFFGRPGMGKTHALANLAEVSINSGFPAIVIQARKSPFDSWSNILKSGLDGFNDWNTIEILNALEALAHTAEVDLVSKSNNVEIPLVKMIIAIDGLDESSSWNDWRLRVDELEAYVKKSPRIQFIITSRDSFDKSKIHWNDYNRIYDIPRYGDTSIAKLYPEYVKRYNTPNHAWIGLALTDLISLRLFCELYRNRSEEPQEAIATTLSQLIKRKIEIIEEEFYEKIGQDYQIQDKTFLKILNELGEEFFNNTEITRTELSQIIISASLNLLDVDRSRQIIDLLCNHGILQEIKIESNESFQAEEYKYQVVSESILEFILASNLVNQVIKNESKEIPATLIEKIRVIQIASEILIGDYSILPGDDNLWASQLSDVSINELKLRSIGSLPIEKQKTYLDFGKINFLKSLDGRNDILEHWIIPNSPRPNSEFNMMFIHDILSSFDNVFSRDLLWSGPDYYEERNSIKRISYLLRDIELLPEDSFKGIPLLLCWSLTNVDNIYREKTRIKLTEWSFKNLGGFLELLKLLFLKYDPQMDEDLSSIAMGVASLQVQPSEKFGELAVWMIKTIFDPKALYQNRNVIIRLAGRSIAEKAHSLDLIQDAELQLSVPPYNLDFEKVDLDMDGTVEGREERYPIVHDLAWYVLDDSFKGFLEYSSANDTHESTDEFLRRYNEFTGGPYEFAMSAAIAYIKSLGWNRSHGPGMTQATHGSKSDVATFEEKYTWLAVHYLRGYLADYVPYKDDYDKTELVADYNKIITIQNPSNHVSSLFFPSIKDIWVVPAQISPELEYSEDTIKDDIKNWVLSDRKIDLLKWNEIPGHELEEINKELVKKDWLAINNDSTLSDVSSTCQTGLHTSAFLVKKSEMNDLLDKIKKSTTEDLKKFGHFDPLDMHTSSMVGSPVDAVFMNNWVKDDYESFDYENSTIHKSRCEITGQVEGSDRHYRLPSRMIRNWLGIKSTNSKVYLNENNEIVAFINEIGQPYYDNQKILFVDKNLLTQRAKEEGYAILWSVFLFQDTTMRIKERDDKSHYQSCRLSIAWKDNDSYEEHVYQLTGWARN